MTAAALARTEVARLHERHQLVASMLDKAIELGDEGVPVDADALRIIRAQLDGTPPADPGSATTPYLTFADMRLVRLIAAGLTNEQIARELGVTVGQAKGYIDNALRHGMALNRAHLVSIAYQQGRLPAAETAAVRSLRAVVTELLRKVETHERRGWEHIALGCFAPLRAVMAAVEPVDLDLLTPEPGSTAARLDALDVGPLPCDGDTGDAA